MWTLDEVLYGERPEHEAIEAWEELKHIFRQAKLTLRQKLILEMRWWEGKSLAEVAWAFGRSVETVRMHERKALRRLAAVAQRNWKGHFIFVGKGNRFRVIPWENYWREKGKEKWILTSLHH